MSNLTNKIYKRLFIVLFIPSLIVSIIIAYKSIDYFSLSCINGTCYPVKYDYLSSENRDKEKSYILVTIDDENESINIPFSELKYIFIFTEPFMIEGSNFNLIRPNNNDLNNVLENSYKEVLRKKILFFDKEKMSTDLKNFYEAGDIFVCGMIEYTKNLDKTIATCSWKKNEFSIEIDSEEEIKDLYKSIIDALNLKRQNVVSKFYTTVILGPVFLILFLLFIFSLNKAYQYIFIKE